MVYSDELVLATHNQGKVREIIPYLGAFFPRITCAADHDITDIAETEKTFQGNAQLKAEHVAQKTNRIALADDSGFCVRALNGFPGVYSARWAQSDIGERDFSLAMNKVYDKVKESDDRACYFISVLALAFPDDRETMFFEGRVGGYISWPPKGDRGFGYDPIFRPDGYDMTFAQMEPEDKQKISHRTQALNGLIAYLNNG